MNTEHILILSCLLVLIQIFIPIIIDYVFTQKINLPYLLSSRESFIENSVYYKRGRRALSNLLETFPIFIVLMFISVFKDIDNSNLAELWLVFRVTYLPTYIIGVNNIRTVLWAGSLVCLVLMSAKLI